MGVERRFQTGIRESDTDAPGLVQEDDGSVWLVAPDGTRRSLSYAENRAEIQCASVDPLTPLAASHAYSSTELVIREQTGSDFSVGNFNTDPEALDVGAIRTASGGWFQAGIVFASPFYDLDAGSDRPRALSLALNAGETGLGGDGDGILPLYDASGSQIAVMTLPGHAPPGGWALYGLRVALLNGFGADEIGDPLGSSGNLFVWQVG